MTAKPVTNLWLDDVRPCPYWGNWTVALNYDQAVAVLSKYTVEQASLDHDLSFEHYQSDNVSGYTEKTGYDLVCWMEAENIWPTVPPVVHSFNPIGAQRMATVLAQHYQCSPQALIRPYKKTN